MHYHWMWTIWKRFFNRSHHGVLSSHISESHEHHKIERKELTLASPTTGIFILANTIKRPLPSEPNNPTTHESIHSSVLHQPIVSSALSGILTLHPKIISPLLPLEEEMKARWTYDPSSPSALAYKKKLKDQPNIGNTMTVSAGRTREIQANKPDPTLMRSFFPCFVDSSR